MMARDYRDLTLTELDFILTKLFHYYVLRNFNTPIDINLNLFFVSRVVLADFNNVVDFSIDTSFLLSDHRTLGSEQQRVHRLVTLVEYPDFGTSD